MTIQKVVDDIALSCFKNYKIKRDGELYELCEIEVYLKDLSLGIDDIFRHDCDEHQNSDEEYVHYSGFDICLGDKDKKIYCGVLVRGLMNDSETIFGPRRVKYNGVKKARRTIEILRSSNKELRFYERSDLANLNEGLVIRVPRVNLSIKRSLQYMGLCSDREKLKKYLNLTARYVRIKGLCSIGKSKGPAEPKEILNSLLLD